MPTMSQKPITKNAFLERLTEIRERWEREKGQRDYYEKFRREIQEYERNASRDFFEALVSGKMDVGEFFRQAERLGLDIVAEVYNIILFTMDTGTESYDISEAYSECEAQRREKMEAFFVDNANAMLFRNNAICYAVLVMKRINTTLENTE